METKPSPFFFVVDELTDSLISSPIPSAQDPAFDDYIDRHALLQELAVARHYQEALAKNPDDPIAAANLLRSLALVERSRSRSVRFKTKSAAARQISQSDNAKPQPEQDDAREFLMSELTQGPRAAADLIARARALGFSAVTLRRAKASLNIISTLHVSSEKLRFWTWSLPDHPSAAALDQPNQQVDQSTQPTTSTDPVS